MYVAEWRACKEELTDVLDSIRQYRLEVEAEERLYERMNEVSIHFEVLREAQSDEMSEIIFPSEETFMRCDCLQELHQEEKAIDDDRWEAVQPAIDAQLGAYRLGVVQRFVGIVLNVVNDCPNVQNYLASQTVAFNIANLADETYETQLDFLVHFAYLFPYTCSRCDNSSYIPETLQHETTHRTNGYKVSMHRIDQVLNLIIGTLFNSSLANKVPLYTRDLDELVQPFECTRCEDETEKYDWRLIVSLSKLSPFSSAVLTSKPFSRSIMYSPITPHTISLRLLDSSRQILVKEKPRKDCQKAREVARKLLES